MRRTWKPTQLLQSGVAFALLLLPFYGTKVHGHDNGTVDMGQGQGRSSCCDNAVDVTPQGSQGKRDRERERELVGPKCYGKIMRRRQRPGVFMAPSARGAWSRSALMSLARRSLATTHFAVSNNSDREQGAGREEAGASVTIYNKCRVRLRSWSRCRRLNSLHFFPFS